MNRPLSDLTVVVPVYANRDSLEPLQSRLRSVLPRCASSFEVLFVNDACPQGSIRVLESLARLDRTVRVVDLPANLGQHQAVLVGMGQANSRRVVVMDADLQDPPELIPELLAALVPPHDVVFPGRGWNYAPPLRLATSKLYRALASLLSGLPPEAGLFFAAERSLVARLLACSDRDAHLVALMVRAGARARVVPGERAPRVRGGSAYTSSMRLRLGVKAIEQIVRARLHRLVHGPLVETVFPGAPPPS